MGADTTRVPAPLIGSTAATREYGVVIYMIPLNHERRDFARTESGAELKPAASARRRLGGSSPTAPPWPASFHYRRARGHRRP